MLKYYCYLFVLNLKKQASDDTEIQLKKLQSDITFAMEKIDSREKHLNSELTQLIQQFKSTSIEHEQIRNLIKETTNEKNNFEQELSRVLHDYENVKIQMDQRGNTMSDGSMIEKLIELMVCQVYIC